MRFGALGTDPYGRGRFDGLADWSATTRGVRGFGQYIIYPGLIL